MRRLHVEMLLSECRATVAEMAQRLDQAWCTGLLLWQKQYEPSRDALI